MSEQLTSNSEIYQFTPLGEPYLYSINRNSFKKSTSVNVFNNFFKERLWKENQLYIILGTDGGLLVDHLLEHGLPYGSRYIFIELPHVIDTINAQLTFTKWDDKVAICSMDDWQEQANKFKIQSYLYTDKIQYLKSLAAIDAFNLKYHDIDTEVTLTIDSLQHKTLASLSRRPFALRQIENISENIVPLKAFIDAFKQKTCIILGGGPSLNDSIEWIKKNKEQLFVIAVSRTAKKLLLENLTPDMIFSLDPHDVSFDVSKEMLKLDPSIVFAHSTYVVPTLSAQWHGRSCYFSSRLPWESKLNSETLNLSGPTITNSAIDAAIQMGFSQILLTGVDLSYGRDGATHATGSNESIVGPRIAFKGKWIETYSGHLAETHISFLHATKILASQGKKAQEYNCELINLSANAAKVDFVSHVPQNKIVITEQLDALSNEKIISSIFEKQKIQGNKPLIQEIDRLIKNLNDINTIAINALSDNSALYRKYANENKNGQFKLKLDKAEKKLNTRFEETVNFVKSFGIQYFIKTVQTDTEEDWSDEKMEETGRIYYQSFVDSINDLKPKLTAAKKRIHSRLEENKSIPNFTVLLNQWEEDKQFSRALNWKSSHSEIYSTLDKSTKDGFEQLIIEHNKIIDNDDTAHFRRSKNQASLVGVERKIVHLYQLKNEDALLQLINSLQNILKDKPDKQWLLHLAQGYLQVIQHNKQLALNEFIQITDENLSEDEATQVATLSIDTADYEQAELYLGKLADFSDNHKPRYAAILKLNNKITESLDVYEQYLEGHPNDINAWLVLGKFYIELNAIESAQIAFSHIINLDGTNSEALQYLSQISNG